MVKPELKGDKPKLLPSESEDSNMDVSEQDEESTPMEKKCFEDDEMAVTIDEARGRKGPRICVFVGLFVFVLVVGFLAVYLIGRTHGKDRVHNASANMADDIARVPTQMPSLANTSKLWRGNVSWETKEELFQLSDAIGSNDIIGLRPIYRKDLPAHYIAYWELKLNGKTGEKYVIISAARETGDHRLAQEGALPSPIDTLVDSARVLSYSCHRVYRLTPDGLMICDDKNVKRTVAATRDIETNSEFQEMKWRELDKQVKRALPRFKKAWSDLSKRVHKLPEWRRFKWLSMKSGQIPTRSSTTGNWKSWSRNSNNDNEDDDDETEEELGLKPGEMLKVPIEESYREIRIRFSGFGNSKRSGRKGKNWSNRWQKRLCRVLNNPCEGVDLTRVKQKYFKLTRRGDRYMKIRIESNTRYVRRQLQGHEVRFRIEIRTSQRDTLVINYGIMLKHSRKGRSVHGVNHYTIPHVALFPDYKQHRHGQCMTGSGAVAWGMVLGYIENVAQKAPQLGYPKNILGLFPGSYPAPLTTTKRAQSFIELIFDKLGSVCLSDAAALTSPAKMARVGKWLRQRNLHLMIENDTASRQKATARTLKLLKEGFPVIVSKERGDSKHRHYAVATALRQRTQGYRTCNAAKCWPWRTTTDSEIYVHLGLGKRGNRWENADTHFMAAIVKQ